MLDWGTRAISSQIPMRASRSSSIPTLLSTRISRALAGLPPIAVVAGPEARVEYPHTTLLDGESLDVAAPTIRSTSSAEARCSSDRSRASTFSALSWRSGSRATRTRPCATRCSASPTTLPSRAGRATHSVRAARAAHRRSAPRANARRVLRERRAFEPRDGDLRAPRHRSSQSPWWIQRLAERGAAYRGLFLAVH